METIELLDKKFRIYISHETIISAVKAVASKMSEELKGEDVLFICVLNGSFMFTADLLKEIKLDQPEVTFLKLSSYEGTDTTGVIKELIGLNEPVEGRTLVVVEDIIDTGITITEVVHLLKMHNPKSVKIATLFYKPEKFKGKMKIDYVGLEIGNEFIVGYGLDYNRKGRNFKDLYVVTE